MDLNPVEKVDVGESDNTVSILEVEDLKLPMDDDCVLF